MIEYLIAYTGIGGMLMVVDWVYYERSLGGEEAMILTRVIGMFFWPIVVLAGVYLILSGKLSVGDFKK